MPLDDALHLLGAGVSLLLGGLGALAPDSAAKFTSLSPLGVLGRSEIRATYGGFFLGLAAFALYTRDEVAFVMLGAGWLGAAVLRLGAAFLDGPEAKVFAAALFEASISLLLLFPNLRD